MDTTPVKEFKEGDKVVHRNRQKYPFWYTVTDVQPYYTNMALTRVWVTIGNTGEGKTFFFANELNWENV